MPHPRFPHESVLDHPQIAPPYCDLWVQQILTKPDHDNQLLNVGAVIANRGQAPPSGPIRVYTVVTAEILSPQLGPFQENTAEWQWYPPTITLPYRTEVWVSAPLHYVEEYGGPYSVWVYVGDENNLAGDHNLNNNSEFLQCPPFHKPATFHEEMQQRLRQGRQVHEHTDARGEAHQEVMAG
jgi:hypothetical protein